ncbi:MAG: HNH endonuclease [Gammaproteobacteria bacterium]|nr:HNH endonuclease [Gammaproteobacteria bacterium]
MQCHHVEHWSNGGETSLDNLLLLCTKHHAGARGRLPDREELP